MNIPKKSKVKLSLPHLRPDDENAENLSEVISWFANRARRKSSSIAIERLFWMLNDQTCDLETALRIKGWIKRLRKTDRSKIENDLSLEQLGFAQRWSDLLKALVLSDNEPTAGPLSARAALSCLGAAYLLPDLINAEGDEIVQVALEPLLAEAGQLQWADSDSVIQPWFEQLLAVEMPLLLSTYFPDFVVSDEWCEPAIEWMSNMIEEKLDSDGWPSASLLPIFGPLVASWTRCYVLLDRLNWELDKEIEEQLRSAVCQLIRLLRSDQRLMFSDVNSLPVTESCLDQLLKLSERRSDKKLASYTFSRAKKQPRKLKHQSNYASAISEWGATALLRADWSRKSARVGLGFGLNNPDCEIGANQMLIQGACFPTIRFNGQLVLSTNAAEVVCQEQDQDVDFLELEYELSQGVRLHRQWLLAREEQILFMADCVTLPTRGMMEYESSWPLANEISVMPEVETREIYLTSNSSRMIQSLVLPLALPEWLNGDATGKLRYDRETNSLQLTERRDCAAAYLPVVFDLCPQRSRQKRTWRQLTIGEAKQRVPRDVAAAFRFQIGHEQWFAYRALASKAPRTFFGEHFSGEFVFGRFKKNGQVTELLRIE